MLCFPELRRVGAVDCCPRRLYPSTMQLPEARFGPSVRRGLADERPSRLRVHGCGLGPEGLGAPNPASPPRRTRREWVSGTGDPQQAVGSREPGADPPRCALGERRPGGENGLRCFPEPRRVGAVCCTRRLSLCRMQLPEARFWPSVRRGLGAERPSCVRGHDWGLGAEGLHAPNPASPPRRTPGEWVSGAGDPAPKAVVPREPGAAPPRFAFWRMEGRGRNRLALLS